MKKAFTLAEVLITLSIIGVISLITIPAININITKTRYETSLKKFYQTANVATQKFLVDKGVRYLSSTGLFSSINANAAVDFSENVINPKVGPEFIQKYFRVLKYCDNSDIMVCYNNQKTILLNGGLYEDPDKMTDAYKFRTMDGMFVYLRPYINILNLYKVDSDDIGNFIVGVYMVDVNGSQRPNVVGKDIFYYHIANNGELIPYGLIRTDNPNTDFSYWKETCPSTHSSGLGCAGRIFEEEWKIKYF